MTENDDVSVSDSGSHRNNHADQADVMAETEEMEETNETSPASNTESPVRRAELLWLATQARPWRSLAIVPAADGMDTFGVASFIAEAGRRHGHRIDVADLRGLAVNRVEPVTTLLLGGADRVIVAMSSIRENVATVSFARAVDQVILCVALGSTSLDAIEDTVRWLGKDRFLGSILLSLPEGETKREAQPATQRATRGARRSSSDPSFEEILGPQMGPGL